MALFCRCHKGFYGFVRSQWVLLVTKPNSSLFILQRNNEKSRNHVVPVVTFLKDNRNVFLTVLATASSRAANLIPIFLIPKPLSTALGKFNSRFPGSILPPQSISEGPVDSWDESILPDTPYIHMTPEVPLYPLGHAVIGQCPPALQCLFMIRLLQLHLKIHLNLFHR